MNKLKIIFLIKKENNKVLIGNTELTREMMPSFVDFSDNPRHLYGLMQDQLQRGLQAPVMMMQQPGLANPQNTPSQWQSKGATSK